METCEKKARNLTNVTIRNSKETLTISQNTFLLFFYFTVLISVIFKGLNMYCQHPCVSRALLEQPFRNS